MWDIWLNLALAATAALANAYAMRYGSPEMRPIRASIAALAAFYTFGYAWLISGVDRRTWSLTLSKVSLVAWAVVWIIPPILAARAHTRMTRTIKERLVPDNEE